VTSTVAVRESFVAAVSPGATSLTSTESSTGWASVSATPGNVTSTCEPVGIVTDFVPSTDGPQSSDTVAVAAVSPFSSATSA
jgi:hypothetical protein